MSILIRKILRGVLNLCFEKALTNFFLFQKKHYIGYLYENDEFHGKLKYSGIVLIRRDNPEILKDLYKKIFNMLD